MEKVIRFGIKKIKEVGFEVEILNNINLEELELSFDLGLQIEEDLGTIGLMVYFSAIDPISAQKILQIKVLNLFFVEDLINFKDGSNFNIPDPALVSMLTLSISHSRALLSKNLNGTDYNTFIMPLIDPIEMAKHFFNIGQESEA